MSKHQTISTPHSHAVASASIGSKSWRGPRRFGRSATGRYFSNVWTTWSLHIKVGQADPEHLANKNTQKPA